jgi:hypothetical protein
MLTTTPSSAPPPEQLLIGHIQAHIKQGEKAKERADKNHKKSEDHFIAAGTYLTTLKVNYAPTWQAWESLLKIKVKLSTGRASELMQLADGRKGLQQVRDGKAESVRALRASQKKNLNFEKDSDFFTTSQCSEDAGGKPPLAWAEEHDLINTLAGSTPAIRNAAVEAITLGSHQSKFELVRDAVSDLYTQLARAGK